MLCIEAVNAEKLLCESGFTREDEPRVLLAGTYSDIDRVCSVILRSMDDNGYSDNDIKHVKMCVFEMLMNAVEHGNRDDGRKKIIVLYTVSPEKIRVSIIDEGNGYDYSKLQSPREPANMFKDRGRGVFIIRELMDEVSFNEKGNRIMICKRHS
jgi:serine/threonine-protein kinase RsbW